MLLEGSQSKEAEVLSGVPQGTVLGPLLFLDYINDLPDVCKSSDTRLFADDNLLFRTINNQKDGILLQQEMWERTWQMSFNAKKCSVMHILPSNKKRVVQTSYHIHGHNLETEDSSKYLGATLDNRLNWDLHINNAVMKGNRTLGFFRRNLKECTTPVKATTYIAIVRPTMEYASTVLDP